MRIWLGKEFLELNRGRKVTLTALNHYKNRLSEIESDKQIEDLPKATRSLLKNEAGKPLQLIENIIEKLETGGLDNISQLENRVDLLEKALKCYREDMNKIESTMYHKYPELFDKSQDTVDEIELINEALENIPKFAEI